MTPGRYYLLGGSSAATTGIGGGNASPNEPGDSYHLPTIRERPHINRATPIEIRSGNELALDFVIPKQQFYSISGKVTTDPLNVANGNATLPPVTLSLAFQTLNGNNGVFTVGQAFDAATGTFTIRDVVPGSYVLQAAAPPSSARLPIEVTNTDIENLVVVVDSGVNINGKFVVEGGEMPAASTMRVQMRLMTNGLQNFVGFAPSAQPAADGSFSLPGVLPAQYRAIVPPSQDFYVKEIRYERADALNNPIEVSRRNSEDASMEILISRNVGQVDGLIVDERMQPIPGFRPCLFPMETEAAPSFTETPRPIKPAASPSVESHPAITNSFSWEALENNGYFDPDVMRRSEALGKPVRVGESSKLFVEGKIIPAGHLK